MQKPEPSNIHQLMIDQDKIEKIKSFHNFLKQMNVLGHSPMNRKQFWSGSLDAMGTMIEILGIKDYLGE